MVRTIRLYGRLKKKFGGEFQLDIRSPAEAIQALCRLVPGFEKELSTGRYKFVRGNKQTGLHLLERSLQLSLGNTKELHLIPCGEAARGLGKTILGAVLIVASFVLPPGPWTPVLRSVGISMVLSGLSMMLSPVPKKKEKEQRNSFMFSGAENTMQQGGPVPLVYGRVKAGSVVISAGLSAEEITPGSDGGGSGKLGDIIRGIVDDEGNTSVVSQNSDVDDGLTDTDSGFGSLRDSMNVDLAKGGKGGGGAPTEVPNSLRSNQTARLVDMISEGPCVGLADNVRKLRSVIFDDVPVQNADGSFNFKGLKLEQRVGNEDDTPIAGFSAAENEVAVSTKVTVVTPVVRAISDTNVDAVRITVRTPSLYKIQDDGDIKASEVQFAIDIAIGAGAYTTVLNTSLKGKTNTNYQRSYRLELPGAGPWNIRMRRITADSVSSKLQNDIFWDSYTEIIDAKLIYPHSAHIGIQVDAQQFGSNLPRRAYDFIGRIIQVPTNYDPIKRTYATSGAGTTGGVWDGTFKSAWSNNPAWVLYDILTHTRYGLGDDVDTAMPNKWVLYEIGQYCDGIVSKGLPQLSVSAMTRSSDEVTVTTSAAHLLREGDYVTIAGAAQTDYNGTHMVTEILSSTQFVFYTSLTPASPATGTITADPSEPRYTINTQIMDRGEAWELLSNMVSVFRGMFFWGAGQVEFSYDHDETPSKIVSRANVKDGELSYSTDSYRGRHSVVIMSWNDPELNDRSNYEVVEDPELISKLGYRSLETTAWGCTSRGQAHRMGRWILDTEKYGEILSYTAGLDHADVRPGTVIEVNDPEYTSQRFSGRLTGASGNDIVLDSEIDLTGITPAYVKCVLPDGTVEEQEISSWATLDGITTLTLDAPFSATPNGDAMWSVRTSSFTPRLFRVFAVTESSPYEFTVTATWHDPNKFARVEQDLDLPPNDFSDINFTDQLQPPSAVDLMDILVREGDATRPGALVSWSASPDPRATFYQYQLKKSEENVYTINGQTTQVSDVVYGLISADDWDVRVRACNELGMRSVWVVESEVPLEGTDSDLPDVTGLAVQTDVDAGTAVLTWDAQPTLELRPILWEILYHASSTDFEDAVSLGKTGTLEWPISSAGNYWVRATFGTTTPGNESMITVGTEMLPTAEITGPNASTVFNYDYLGAPESGQVPRDFIYNLYVGGAVVTTGVTWTYTVITGEVNGFVNADGPQSMTGSGAGELTVSSFETSTASVQVTATTSTVVKSVSTSLTKTTGSPPSGGGGSGSSLVFKLSGFGSCNDTTFDDITGTMTGTTPAGVTAVDLNCNLYFNPGSGTPNGAWVVEVQFQRYITGVWTDIDSPETGNSSRTRLFEPDEIDVQEAQLSFTVPDTGLTASTSYDWRLLARVSSGGTRVHTAAGAVSVIAA